MNRSSILLIDAGNTRIKFGLGLSSSDADGTAVQWLGHCDSRASALEIKAFLLACDASWHQVRGVCVAGANTQQAVSEALHALGHTVDWLTALSPLPGLRNDYATPSRLGADRWLAALGLVQHSKHPTAPLVLATFGTATTVDVLCWDAQQQCHAFVGGIIFAGLATALRSVSHSTAHLPDQSNRLTPLQALSLPNTTDDALLQGAIYAQVGAVEQVLAQVQRQHGAPALWISGGAAAVLQPFLPQAQWIETPVLQGLAWAEPVFAKITSP
jgi:type III pantothenate kinase